MRYSSSLILSIAVLSLAAPERAGAQKPLPFAAPALPLAGPKPTPFANNDGQIPPGWTGPLFQLSHAYPNSAPPFSGDPPWQKAIGNGLITVQNAASYVAALKNYISADMRVLLFGRRISPRMS